MDPCRGLQLPAVDVLLYPDVYSLLRDNLLQLAVLAFKS